MKASELRLGNYALSLNGIITVRGIEADYDDLYGETLINDWKESSISPIPLTEEWLLKFGVQSIPHFTVGNTKFFDIGRNRQLSISSVNTPNCMVFLQDMENNARHEGNNPIVLHNYDYDGPLYVHQIQNLFYCLTGEELTIKE